MKAYDARPFARIRPAAGRRRPGLPPLGGSLWAVAVGGAVIEGEYCHCIESALANVPPDRKLPGSRSCRLCWGYGCNSPKHPGVLSRPIARRLSRAPYYLTSSRAAKYARKLAAAEDLKRLKEGWKLQEEGKLPPATVGHCSRCSQYRPLRPEDRRCASCNSI